MGADKWIKRPKMAVNPQINTIKCRKMWFLCVFRNKMNEIMIIFAKIMLTPHKNDFYKR